MARDWLSIGSRWNRRAYLGIAAVISATGCQSTDRDDSFGSLDARTRQMLLAPAGGSLKAPPQQYAITDPAATGAKGITPGNSFNRPMMAQPTYTAQNDSNSQNTTGMVPNNTGVMQTVGVSAPTMPTSGGNLQLQPKVQQAQFTTPATPVTQAPAYNGPPVNVIGTVPPTMPNPPASAVSTMQPPGLPPLAPPITPTSTTAEFTPPTAIVVPPAMPVVSEAPAPAMPAQIIVAPASPEAPKLTGGMTTLLSPTEQPPAGFGPIAPAPLK